MVVRVGCRWAHSHYDFVTGQFELPEEPWLGFEPRGINVFFYPLIGTNSFLCPAMQVRREEDSGNNFPARPDQRRGLRVLIIHDHHCGNAQEVAEEDLGARPVR